MALTDCPECHRQVSVAARACPHCGYPLQHSTAPIPDRTQTIEQTSKHWKAAQLIGAAALILGVVWALWSAASDGSAIGGIVLMLTGIVTYTIGRMGAWWYHG